MGNCIETCRGNKKEAQEMQGQQEQREENEMSCGFVKESSNIGKNGMRVKIVLTKEELGWLMIQLRERGGKGLEEVLREIEKGRGKVENHDQGWKPSLESIKEIPEVIEIDR